MKLKNMNLDDVRDWLRTANREDLDNVNLLMKLRRVQIGAEIGMNFVIGEMVEFESPDKGILRGKFIGIKRKNASIVLDNGDSWTVSPGLLKKIV